MNVNEICFEFKDDVEDKEYYLGYFSNHEKPYWVGQCDIKDGCGFYIVEDLINAKIYNGKSLLECWDNISLLTIEGVPIDEWLEYLNNNGNIIMRLYYCDKVCDGSIITYKTFSLETSKVVFEEKKELWLWAKEMYMDICKLYNESIGDENINNSIKELLNKVSFYFK